MSSNVMIAHGTSPSMSARRPATTSAVENASGSRRCCIAAPSSSAITRPDVRCGWRRRAEPFVLRPLVERHGEVRAAVGVPSREIVGELGVARRVQPQLDLEQQPRVAVVGVGRHRVGPQRPQTSVEVGRALDVGGDPRRRLVEPLLDQCEQQPVLAAEVAVERAGRAVRRIRHRFGRHGVESLAGEQVRRRRDQPRPGLRLALFLRLRRHRYIQHISDRPIYVASVSKPDAGVILRPVAGDGAEGVDGKVVIVTGAGQGIGRGHGAPPRQARRAHRRRGVEGAPRRAGRRRARRTSASTRSASSATSSSERRSKRLVSRTIDRYGRVDALINNAHTFTAKASMADVDRRRRRLSTTARSKARCGRCRPCIRT